MRRSFMSVVSFARIVTLACVLSLSASALAKYPEPSPYPISWELSFENRAPQRIVVHPPGSDTPQAYWYMTYTVTNNTDQDQTFIPLFELLTEDGQVIRSDDNIPFTVFEAIKTRERNKYLEPSYNVSGRIRIGEDGAKEGVAIWREPGPEMGRFSIFVNNLNGEAVIYKKGEEGFTRVTNAEQLVGQDMKDVTLLRKTLQLNYFVRGDEVYPGEDEVNENASQWVMR
ncbi:MAG: hypothetical protein ACREIT_00545 [Tepidisphaeraceae bacterium]